MKKRFENKVAIVSGGDSGIGLATAKRLASEGAKIVLVGRNSEKLQAAEKVVKAAGSGDVWASTCDVANEEDVLETVKGTLRKYGQLDIVINSAGLMIFKKFEDHTTEDWMKVLGVDLMGTVYLTQAAFRHMKAGGSVVNVSSIHAVETTPLVASYAAAKAAVLSLTRSAAIEGKERGIRVNAVLPGAIETPMLRENPNLKSGKEVLKEGDVGEPEDVASAIAYLASDEARFIQGTSLRVDGGRLSVL